MRGRPVADHGGLLSKHESIRSRVAQTRRAVVFITSLHSGREWRTSSFFKKHSAGSVVGSREWPAPGAQATTAAVRACWCLRGCGRVHARMRTRF